MARGLNLWVPCPYNNVVALITFLQLLLSSEMLIYTTVDQLSVKHIYPFPNFVTSLLLYYDKGSYPYWYGNLFFWLLVYQYKELKYFDNCSHFILVRPLIGPLVKASFCEPEL